MQALIMAGGFGTRIQSVAKDVPKPLIKVNGVPVLERTINQLSKYGVDQIILTVSYLKEQIIEYFGNGSRLGVKIEYFVEDEPLGSAGAIFKLKDKFSGDFFVINGDLIFDVDLAKMLCFHQNSNALLTLFAHPNSHPFDSTLLDCNSSGFVNGIYKEDNKPSYYKNCVNAGIHILNSSIFNHLDSYKNGKKNFDNDITLPAIKTGRVVAYTSTEYVKDMGTPDRLITVEQDLTHGIVEARNINKKQKAIFLDRDGTINKYVGFLTDIEQLELIPNVANAIKQINNSGYLTIVVTNQPVIARGEVTFDQLDLIHKKLETLLGKEGAHIDALYYCPHHPHSGYEGEIKELKIECECRKPKPGMLLQAARDYNIDLSKSYMIGDSDNDLLAGENAGCKAIKIENAEAFWQKFDIKNL